MAERSYPASKVRGDGREEIPRFRDKVRRPGGVNPLLRSGATAGRSHPVPEARGGGRECQAATAQEWPRGATTCLRSGAAAGRSYSTPEVMGVAPLGCCHVQGALAAWAQEGLEELLHVQRQEGRW